MEGSWGANVNHAAKRKETDVPAKQSAAIDTNAQQSLHLQRTVGNRAVQRLIHAERQETGSDSSGRADGLPGQTGRPLDVAARRYFEPRFGHDFSQVRVYSDGPAARSASALGARAYTIGEAIMFNQAEYSPERASGRHLLAHELAHVVQQRRGGAPASVTGDPNLEAAAQNAADGIARGTPVAVTGAAAIGIARQPQAQGPEGASAGQPIGD